MAIIQSFGGIVPRFSKHLLDANMATEARDVKLRNGRIEAWREKVVMATVPNDTIEFYQVGCCTIPFSKCVSLTTYLPEFNMIYVTGNDDKPQFAPLDCEDIKFRYLGVPTPVSPPEVALLADTGRDVSARTYVYTYKNMYGEEGAPSPPSRQIVVKDGTTVTVSNLAFPPDYYDIVSCEIYRTGTGYRVGNEKTQELMTDYFHIGTVAFPASSFTDSFPEESNEYILNTRETRMPPDNIREICHIQGTGVLAACGENTVHFSKNMQPWNWPQEYDLILPHNIVHMRTMDNLLYITTNGPTYIIDATPVGEGRQCRPVLEGDYPYPDIACGFKSSAIMSPFGMMFVTKYGIGLLKQNGQVDILTREWYSSDDWVKMQPTTARLAFWRGYIFFVSNSHSFILEIDGDTYADYRIGSLSEISDKPIDMVVSDTEELLMLENNSVWQWNAGDTYRNYFWKSRELSLTGKHTPLIGKVRGAGTHFCIMPENSRLSFCRYIGDDTPFRIRRMGRNLNYFISFSGSSPVEYVSIGTAFMTINTGE